MVDIHVPEENGAPHPAAQRRLRPRRRQLEEGVIRNRLDIPHTETAVVSVRTPGRGKYAGERWNDGEYYSTRIRRRDRGLEITGVTPGKTLDSGTAGGQPALALLQVTSSGE